MMKFYYDRLKTKTLKKKNKTKSHLKTSNIITLFIIKRFAQINIFKLSDDILHSIHFNKLLQGFV